MSSNKDKEFKDFLISFRKKIGPGITNAPVWAMQKTNERIWNPTQNRHWQQTAMGQKYRSKKLKEDR